MPFRTKRQRVILSTEQRAKLEILRRSRSGVKREILHAAILLDSSSGMSDGAVARSSGVNRHTVALCIRKFLQFGLDAALGELPRPGKSRSIPDDAIAWVQHCACQKPKEVGYAHDFDLRDRLGALGDHLKTGHTGSPENRPMRNRVRTLTYTLSDPSLAMDFHSRMESNIY
jgi:transposase